MYYIVAPRLVGEFGFVKAEAAWVVCDGRGCVEGSRRPRACAKVVHASSVLLEGIGKNTRYFSIDCSLCN